MLKAIHNDLFLGAWNGIHIQVCAIYSFKHLHWWCVYVCVFIYFTQYYGRTKPKQKSIFSSLVFSPYLVYTIYYTHSTHYDYTQHNMNL